MEYDEQWKANVRKLTGYAIKLKILIPGPCAVCFHPISAAHHPEYSKPLDVIWLCNVCHAKHHQLGHTDSRNTLRLTEITVTLKPGSLNVRDAIRQLEGRLLDAAAQVSNSAGEAERLLGVTKEELRTLRTRWIEEVSR